MYHSIIRAKLRQGFVDISAARFEDALRNFAPDVRFSFAGQHCMASQLRDLRSVRAWFERVHRLFPDLQLEPQRILVNGWPWNTLVVTWFQVSASLPDGTKYLNDGLQVVRLRWGRVTEDDLIEDTAKLRAALELLARYGVDEAQASPIADSP